MLHSALRPSPFLSTLRSLPSPVARFSHVHRIVRASADEGTSVRSPADLPAVIIPDSQELAISEAVGAVQLQLQPLLKSNIARPKPSSRKKAQGFSSKQATSDSSSTSSTSGRVPFLGLSNFAIEIPAADQSPAAAAELALSVASEIQKQLGLSAGALTLVVADEAEAVCASELLQQRKPGSAAAGAAAGGLKVLALQQACRSPNGLKGVLLLSVPRVADVALVEQLLNDVWTGPGCVLLNPEFPASPVPEQYQQVSESILVVWSFLPLLVSGLLQNKEGAVLRQVGQAGPMAPDASWRILYKVGDKLVQVGKTDARPKPDDLELAMMNASAATSPLTQTVKMFRGLLPGNWK